MNLKFKLFLIHTLLLLISCRSKKDKIEALKDASQIEIQVNSYGGLSGYHESQYLLVRTDNERYMMCNIDEDYAKKIPFPKDKDSIFNQFLETGLRWDNPDRKHKSGCFGSTDRVYEISSGWTSLTLSPIQETHDLFDEMTKE